MITRLEDPTTEELLAKLFTKIDRMTTRLLVPPFYTILTKSPTKKHKAITNI